jgi:hypothetical protein
MRWELGNSTPLFTSEGHATSWSGLISPSPSVKKSAVSYSPLEVKVYEKEFLMLKA